VKELDNLVKINRLKVEPADAKEFAGMDIALMPVIWCFNVYSILWAWIELNGAC
jgi:hypothetical protein